MVYLKEECWASPDFCPLVKYGVTAGRPDRNKPLEVIGVNDYQSDGDARFVQRWYPAEG